MKPINIVGGGLAGLALGIGLRRAGVPVVVWEQGHYPRHRVCGEFISGQGQEILRSLGLIEALKAARSLRTVAFFSPTDGYRIHVLPRPALSLSRFAFDTLLAEILVNLGGEVHCGSRCPKEQALAEGWVRASGRRTPLPERNNGWRWFGVKAHARNAALIADLEMHIRTDGYVGISWLPDGNVNVCGLLRQRKGQSALPGNVPEKLLGVAGTPLYHRLATVEFEQDSFCAVGGLDLCPCRAADLEECSIGDALTMIPPITGNGMSMAFESAELALEPLTGYARAEISWETARQRIAEECDHLFHRRLRWAGLLQKLLFYSTLRSCVLPWALKWEAGWRFLFRATR